MPRGAPGVLEFDDETALIVKDQGTAQRIAEAVKTLVATCKRE
jgi:hypothetical protein